MTIETTENVATWLTDGTATDFDYTFKVFEKGDIQLFLRDADDVLIKTYAQNEFTISGLGTNSGTISILPAPADGHRLLMNRVVPLFQSTDIVNQGGFFPEVIEKQLDLIVMQIQQVAESLDRCVTASLGNESYEIGLLGDLEVVQLQNGKLGGITVADLAAPANAAAALAQGYVAALVTYTFGYIGVGTSAPPADVGEGEGYVYTIDGRVYGALNSGGSADVQFELLTAALADTGGAGNGTVVSVDVSGGTTGLSFSGGPVTTTGTITLAGNLGIANGGTGGTTASTARSALGAAGSGANTDITSIRQSTIVAETGTATANALGFRGLPASAQSLGSAIALALSDSGKMVLNTLGGWVVPANVSVAFPIGSTVILYNDSASAQTLSITSDTLRQAGTANTGSRSVAARGFATLVKVKATEWVVSGNIS